MKNLSTGHHSKMNIVSKFILAGVVRLMFVFSDYRQIIAGRVEVSTLLNSWRRVTEGVFLHEQGMNPYDGDIFHETPIGLVIFSYILKYLRGFEAFIFIASDLLTGFALYLTASAYMKEMEEKQEAEKEKYSKNVSKLLLDDEYFKYAPKYVLVLYLFNPYNILNCVGYTTTNFGNLCLAFTLLSMTKVSIYIARMEKNKFLSILWTVFVFSGILAGLVYISHEIVGDWKFLRSVYVLILSVTDLRPNIGLFWYFFTEMFEHFRLLFIFSFQLNATLLYLTPLSLRFHQNPLLLATSLIALGAVFKSYPSLGDVGFYLSLLPMWKHLYNRMQQGFIIFCSLVVTSVLGPTVWYLWIYSRSANANFYFGVTLAFATAQIFLITDLLFAYIKREFSLKEGFDSEEKIVLKLTLE